MTERPLRRWLRILAFGVAVGAAGYVVGGRLSRSVHPPWAGGPSLAAWKFVAVAGCGLLTLWVALLVHELGHLFGGSLVGFRAWLLIVGPVRLERNENGWQWRLNTNLSLIGGLAGALPTTAVHLRGRSAVMIAGGPLASVLLGVIALIGSNDADALYFSRDAAFLRLLTSTFWAMLAGWSILVAIATLSPGQTSGFMSDGARLWLLLFGGPLAEREAALGALSGMSAAGVRPRHLDPALIEATLTPADGSMSEVAAWTFVQARAADTGQDADARRWLEQIMLNVEKLPTAFRPAIQLDAARQFAMWGAVSEARAQMQAVRGPAIGAPYAKPLAEAALLIAEGRQDAGRTLLPRVRTLLAESIDRGGSAALLDAVDELERRAG